MQKKPSNRFIQQSLYDSEQQQQHPLPKRISTSFVRQIQLNNKSLHEHSYTVVNEILRNTLNYNVCKICANSVEESDMRWMACGHRFCVDCLEHYCVYKIGVNEDVYCMEEGCKEKLKEDTEIFVMLPAEVQARYKEYNIWKQSLINQNIKLCPNQNCKGGQVNLLKIPPECKKCHTKYCKECMMKYHQGLCDQNFQTYFKQLKRCPKCKIFIKKNQGCNHVTCKCGYKFCFVCLTDWNRFHYECLEPNDRMFFNQVEQIGRAKAILGFLGVLLFFPVVLAMILMVLAFAGIVGFVVGIVLPLWTLKQIILQVQKHIQLLIIFFLPIMMLASSFLTSLFCMFVLLIPLYRRILRKYCNSLVFCLEQATNKSLSFNLSFDLNRHLNIQQFNRRITNRSTQFPGLQLQLEQNRNRRYFVQQEMDRLRQVEIKWGVYSGDWAGWRTDRESEQIEEGKYSANTNAELGQELQNQYLLAFTDTSLTNPSNSNSNSNKSSNSNNASLKSNSNYSHSSLSDSHSHSHSNQNSDQSLISKSNCDSNPSSKIQLSVYKIKGNQSNTLKHTQYKLDQNQRRKKKQEQKQKQKQGEESDQQLKEQYRQDCNLKQKQECDKNIKIKHDQDDSNGSFCQDADKQMAEQ